MAVYVRLEQARFPGRLEAELPASDRLPATQCVARARSRRRSATRSGAGSASAAAASASRCAPAWTGRRSRPQLDEPGDPAGTTERVRIPLAPGVAGSAA